MTVIGGKRLDAIEMKKILVADSGATKTDWVAVRIEEDGSRTSHAHTGPGISPLHHREDSIYSELRLVREELGAEFDQIRFYGAGLGTEAMRRKMVRCLADTFSCADIDAQGDMLGSARALLGDRPGVACIMGTGSNSCHYDGEKIDFQPSSLGYLLDDEGGGVAFGRRLLADLFKGMMSREVTDLFNARYNLSYEELIENLYRRQSPNRWIAQFTHFLIENQDLPEISSLIDDQLARFLDREFAAYPEDALKREGVAFAGSMAFLLQDRIRREFERRGWKLADVVRRPVLELI